MRVGDPDQILDPNVAADWLGDSASVMCEEGVLMHSQGAGGHRLREEEIDLLACGRIEVISNRWSCIPRKSGDKTSFGRRGWRPEDIVGGKKSRTHQIRR